MKFSAASFGLLALSASGVHAWGNEGHQAVGYIAMKFLAPRALRFVKSSLGSAYNESLGVAATWADVVKSKADYKWSADLHYVDALDAPPKSCSVDEKRDCPNGECILGAISNYTTRVADPRLPADQRQEALKFITHFVGDIGQPLHAEAVAVGGNSIDIHCSGKKGNLHSLWDTLLIQKHLTADFNKSVTAWADSLSTRIRRGDYRWHTLSWLSCYSPYKTVPGVHYVNNTAHNIKALACPLVWAKDSNSYDCSYVFNYANGTDLCDSDYYTNAIPIIESQIAKQGFRLAAWLNELFDGASYLP